MRMPLTSLLIEVLKLERISNIQHGMINVHGEGLLRRAGEVRKLERNGDPCFTHVRQNPLIVAS
jgi:hypothetical protein